MVNLHIWHTGCFKFYVIDWIGIRVLLVRINMRILMVSYSCIFKRSCTSIFYPATISVRKFSDASPTADNVEVTSENMYDKLLEISETRETVSETLNQFISNGFPLIRKHLFDYTSRLRQKQKSQQALKVCLSQYCLREFMTLLILNRL